MPPDALADWQTAFAARLRDPRRAPLPAGTPAGRARVYANLLFNNLEGFLLACYPVSRRLLGARAWRRTVRAFFAGQRSHSPLFRDIPKAFLDWLAPQAATLFPALPWLTGLMHYEWLELAASIAPDGPGDDAVDPDGDLLAGRPALAPGTRLASYAYPVHRIGPRFRPGPADAGAYAYLVYRDAADGVRFITLSPLALRLLERLRDATASGRTAVAELADEAGPAQRETYLTAGADLLRHLRAEGALLGTWRES